MVGKRVKCPVCSAIVSIDPSEQSEVKPSTPPTPRVEEPLPAQPTVVGKPTNGGIRPVRTPSGSIFKALVLSCFVVAVLFVITFLAGGLTAILIPIVKSLQGEGNKSLFQIAAFAIIGLCFIGSFLTFNLLPLLTAGVACAGAGEELGKGASRPRHVVASLAVTLLSAALLWVFLPWLQHFPYKTAEWSESTLTTYRLVYVIANAAIGLIFAAKAGSRQQQPVTSRAATPRDGE